MNKKPVFETMVEPQEETKEQLRGWREPGHAYILLEVRRKHLEKEPVLDAEGKPAIDRNGRPIENTVSRWGWGLWTLRCDHRPDVGEKLTAATINGGRVIHYANFPKVNSPNPMIAQKARMHTGPNGVCAWDELERKVRGVMNVNPNWSQEKSVLEKKLAEATAQLEAQNGRKTSKGNTARASTSSSEPPAAA